MRLGVVGEEQQAHVRVDLAEPLGGGEAAVGLRRHPDVEHGHVGRGGGEQLPQLVAPRGHGHHLVPGRLQEHLQALPEEGSVFGQRYSHGTRTSVVSPLSTVPPSA